LPLDAVLPELIKNQADLEHVKELLGLAKRQQ
jgi:hypothetical protein